MKHGTLNLNAERSIAPDRGKEVNRPGRNQKHTDVRVQGMGNGAGSRTPKTKPRKPALRVKIQSEHCGLWTYLWKKGRRLEVGEVRHPSCRGIMKGRSVSLQTAEGVDLFPE